MPWSYCEKFTSQGMSQVHQFKSYRYRLHCFPESCMYPWTSLRSAYSCGLDGLCQSSVSTPSSSDQAMDCFVHTSFQLTSCSVKTSLKEQPVLQLRQPLQLTQCQSSSYLLRPPGQFRATTGNGPIAPCHFEEASYASRYRRHHCLRLKRAATERDGMRCSAQQVQVTL